MDTTVIIEAYLAGKSLAQLSKDTGISTYKLKKLFINNNVHIRSKEEQNKYSPQNQRKYKINDNYFDIINSDNAYLLGFLAADGCIEKDGSIKIGLSSIDKQFLEAIKLELQSNYPIRDYQTKDGFNISEFIFRSQKIKDQLQQYGIVNKKTYSFLFPYNLPQKYWIDFIRGYWDGDGTFCLSGLYTRASLCAYNKKLLEQILDILEKTYNISKVNIYQNKSGLYYFQYSHTAAKQLYKIFYNSHPKLYLFRKYEKCKQLFGDIVFHEPATSQEEDKIV